MACELCGTPAGDVCPKDPDACPRPLRFEVRRVPVHDTGLGREAGYANDQELVAAAAAERAAMDPSTRLWLERVDQELERRILFGGPA